MFWRCKHGRLTNSAHTICVDDSKIEDGDGCTSIAITNTNLVLCAKCHEEQPDILRQDRTVKK